MLSDRLLILCTACTNLGGSGERRSDCHEGRKPGKLAFRGEQLFKEGENPAGGYDIVSYTPGKNKREVLIPASMFVKPGTSDTLSVRSFSFDTSHKQVLVYTNTRRVWR